MTNITHLITFASWEDRFRLGFERDLTNARCSSVLVFFYDAYAAWTEKNREFVERACRDQGIEIVLHSLQLNQPAANWHLLCKSIQSQIPRRSQVVIDISTMPRDVIWNILWLLEIADVEVRYYYHCPEEYACDWLSRDPGAPRLVYKLSGLPLFSARTALLVTAGYDIQRVKQLIAWYEPEKVFVGLQADSRFKHNEFKMADYRAVFAEEQSCSLFELDAYSADHGQEAVQHIVDGLKPSHNIVMSSLGPKVTAVSLYCVQRANPEVALAYAPSNQFNKDYSKGIGDSIAGTLKWMGSSQ